MPAKSTYLNNKLLAQVLTATAYTPPAAVYAALFNGNPTSGGTEVTGGSYTRQAAAFTAPASSSTSNSAGLTFSNMPATTVSYIAIYDASTAGNLLYYAPATASKTTNPGDTVTIAAGGIVVTES
jgi:hypothetical protein